MVRINPNHPPTAHQARFGAETPNGTGNGAGIRGAQAFEGFAQQARPGESTAASRPMGQRLKAFFRGDIKGAFFRAVKMALLRPRGWAETAISLMAFGGIPVFFLKNLAEGLIGANTWVAAGKRMTIFNVTGAHNSAFHVGYRGGDLLADQNRTVWGALKGLLTGKDPFDQAVAKVWKEGGEAGRTALKNAGIDLNKAGIEA